MSSDLIGVIIGGLVGILGTLLGTVLNHYLTVRREEKKALRDQIVKPPRRPLKDWKSEMGREKIPEILQYSPENRSKAEKKK